ncbi:peptidoglycan D,D-transpeptidase FtsI family protein [Corynebacterium bovis]|uniref:peptidoglycan D,D-transpeptidase FtsI family protein n=1 Tax=Corynebacterium bovis TaxID=36808 RepID=UPI000F64522E|nr:penicillin-binding protein 2 [Corynebacterium bovis]RRO79923.1 cell division protein FtsI [Corynebacterium bovis]RRO80796.1 cell division protein FtsI [Corynebacterium bovis]RRO82389.1 cell division protein FtsI [Corynebacterium bovis]RRO87364.1 cell division protein FtsI [Corynebacterium bovis]RRO95027.1 cell division protein FtsI [Corynebacterium bovis]
MIVDASAPALTRRLRHVFILIVIIVLAVVVRLAWVQLVTGPSLAAQAEAQRTAVITEPAHRGTITDRNGRDLAYTMEARLLSVHPKTLRSFMQERHDLDPDTVPGPDDRIDQIVRELPGRLEASGVRVNGDDLRKKLTADDTYEVLARTVDPDVAEAIVTDFPEITAERQDIRKYPNGAVAENVIGKISTDNEGQFGLELSQDGKLQGVNGSRTVDVAGGGYVIPGSTRDEHPPVDGASYRLTLDVDAQTYIQQQVQQAKEKSLAESASAVVLDAHTGQVVSMATSDTINPEGDLEKQLARGKVFGDRTVSDAFEPGSVGKVITASAAIEEGKTTPDEVLQVPGSIEMSGVTVRDAWEHGVAPFTTTGVFGKSSNVGTLMLAQRVGEDSFADYLHRFGIGQATGIGLPSETSGYVPDRNQWSGGTFANLPIGQGMSMSLLQMTSIYQAIANDGVRVEPRIISGITGPDGTEEPVAAPGETRVVSPETARTVRSMFRSVVQKDPTGVQQGSGSPASIEGYQITGKTGTAQQIDPRTKAYSNSNYWITFAGIAPADDPRFVVGIMLDKPQRGTDGGGGQSAAPLFHDIGSWLLDHYNVPLSGDPGPKLMLEAQ